MAMYERIIYHGGEAELVVKKSRFLAVVEPVASEEEALAFIAARKREYWDARHNCSACIIGSGGNLMRCSDDGEPAQTAGRPMLDVLSNAGVYDAVAVVTRYFGGVLLGTGGLVRAYQGAVQAALDNCTILCPKQGQKVCVTMDYNDYGRVEYLLREQGIAALDATFGAEVCLQLCLEEDAVVHVQEQIADATRGKGGFCVEQPVRFAEHKGEIIIF